jgi:hypothetical protein
VGADCGGLTRGSGFGGPSADSFAELDSADGWGFAALPKVPGGSEDLENRLGDAWIGDGIVGLLDFWMSEAKRWIVGFVDGWIGAGDADWIVGLVDGWIGAGGADWIVGLVDSWMSVGGGGGGPADGC